MPDDKKFALSRRQALGGLGAIGAAAAGAGLGTTALFSDTESFNNNSVTAGQLDLVVDYVTTVTQDGVDTGSTTADGQIQDGESMQYAIADAKPGDSGFLAFCPKIVDNPGWLFVGSAGGVTDYENGQTEPEGNVDGSGGGNLNNGTNDGAGAGELSEAIQVTVSYCEAPATNPSAPSDFDTIRELNNPDDYTLADLFKELESGFLLDGDAAGSSGTQAYPSSPDNSTQNGPCLCIEWEIPSDVGNEIQSDAVAFDITFAARQERNNPDPENPFAAITVWPGGSIQNALDSATSGDVISVFGGSFGDGTDYNEELDIGTSGVTLARASAEQPTIKADAQSDNRAITVTAPDVTLDGLDITFQGGAGSSPNAEKYGIEVRAGSHNLTVCNCNIRDIKTDEAGRDGSGGTTDVNAVRSTGITIKSTLGSGSSVSAPTVRHNTFENLVCTGSTTQDGNADSDSRAKGVALVGDISDAEISGNKIVGIGAASNDPRGAQISTVNKSSAPYTTSKADNKAAEGTDKPRGITIIQSGASAGPENFVIENNVLGGTGSDAIVGVYGQPAIFIGSNTTVGSDHDVRGNDIYHPVDMLNSSSPALALNGDNTWYDTSGNTQTPSLVAPDSDADGGNLIDRGTSGTADRYQGY